MRLPPSFNALASMTEMTGRLNDGIATAEFHQC